MRLALCVSIKGQLELRQPTETNAARMENMSSRSTSNYHDAFEPSAFLERYYSNTANTHRVQHTLRCYHDAFQTLSNDLKVLDYGSGPVILAAISAATKASEIVLSDYADQNRKALRHWLDGDSAAFDWSPHFDFVVRELEGKGERDVKERQERVRKLVKAVVHCDIWQDPPIERGYDQLYDVVISSLVIECTASNDEDYVSNASRLGKLVKPGGSVLIYGVENKTGYVIVGDYKFSNYVNATAELTLKSLKDAGFTDLTVDKFSHDHEPSKIYRFIKGIRKN